MELAILIAVCVVFSAGSVGTTSVQSVRGEVVMIGQESVNLTCYFADFDVFNQTIKWIKVDNRNLQYTQELSDLTTLSRPSNHYSVAITMDGTEYVSTLTIHDVRISDDANYLCAFAENGRIMNYDTVPLVVLQPISSLSLTVGPYTVNSSECIERYQLGQIEPDWTISCSVTGSNPRAEVRVTIGEEDITSRMNRRDDMVVVGPMLESYRSYSTVLNNTMQTFNSTIFGTLISCKAWVEGFFDNPLTANAVVTERIVK